MTINKDNQPPKKYKYAPYICVLLIVISIAVYDYFTFTKVLNEEEEVPQERATNVQH